MKILMASHYFASHKGGIEIVAEELFRGLAAKGEEVVWLAGDATPAPVPICRSRPLSLRMFNLVEEKVGLPFPIPTVGALRKISSEMGNTDVLILHDCLYLCNLFAFLLARVRGVPTIVVQHIGLIPYRSRVLNAAMRFFNAVVTRPVLLRATQVVFVSETTKDFFGDLPFRRPPEIVFNGVDADLYRTLGGAETKPGVRREYDLPEAGRVILFVGRFVEKKGIRAMARMVELRPDWTWAFAGWGLLDPRGWSAANVRVLANLRGPSMAALYRACDLLVLPSRGEGFPLVVQEALASGLPVVCGAETLGADPALEGFARGVRIYEDDDARTAREFVSAIDASLDLESASGPDSEARRAFVVSRYSWQHAVERYLGIASGLVAESVSPTAPLRDGQGRGPWMTLRRSVLLLASVALGVLLAAVLIRVGKVNLRLTLVQLESVSRVAFLKLVVLNGLLVCLSTAKWRAIDAALRRSSDSVPSTIASFAITSAGMALGLVLPVQVGMTAARTLGTYVHGRPLKRGAAGTLFEQSFDLLIVVFLAVASGVTWLCAGSAVMWVGCAAFMTVLAFLAVGPFIGLIRSTGASLSARTVVPRNRILQAVWEIQHSSLLSVALARRLVILSAIRFGVVVLMAAQTAEMIHAQIPLWHMAAAVPFVVIATVIAVTPGGIGVNELTSTTALKLFGSPLGVAAQWSVANRFLVTASCFAVAACAASMWAVGKLVTRGARDANNKTVEEAG